MFRILWLFLGIFLLAACTDGTVYAPVTEISTIDPLPKNGIYRVQMDDTLYSIAWRYGLDYRDLAKNNRIDHPYHIEVGQEIYLRKSSPKKMMTVPQEKITPKILPPIAKNIPHTIIPIEKEPNIKFISWRWPTSGTVVGKFCGLNKGINIAGEMGQPIVAAGPGKVVYCGNGLRAYGNLIIIKHNNILLSAYAHNRKACVTEGMWVKGGQKIAEMGNNGNKGAMLHFEIRSRGKPINPMFYLKRKH